MWKVLAATELLTPHTYDYNGLKLLYQCGILDRFSGNHNKWSVTTHSSFL